MFLGIDFSKLIILQFWFSPYPGRLSRTFLFVFVSLCILLVLGAVILRLAQIYYRSQPVIRGLVRRAASYATTLGLLGLLFIFFRQEEVYIFNARIWFLILAFLATGMIYSLVRLAEKQKLRAPTN